MEELKPAESGKNLADAGSKTVDAENGINADIQLYDEAWRSEDSDATSLLEVPLDYLGHETVGHQHAVNDAIAEVSGEFLSGKGTNLAHQNLAENDEAPDDRELKLVSGRAYVAHYQETAALSDNDWNPYGTESDSNPSPRLAVHQSSDPKAAKSLSQSSFNPPFHSTDLQALTPSVVMDHISDHSGSLTDADDQPLCVVALEPDIPADFSSVLSAAELSSGHEESSTPPTKENDLNRTLVESGRKTMPRKNYMSLDLNLTAGKVNKDEFVETDNKVASFQSLPAAFVDNLQEETLEKTLTNYHHLDSHRGQLKQALDYNLLQRDLQDIQNSLQSGHLQNTQAHKDVEAVRTEPGDQTPVLRDKECDIIPSTTATPEDHELEDFNFQQLRDHFMTLAVAGASSEAISEDANKMSYHSDGDETRTSGSSDRVGDHVLADHIPEPDHGPSGNGDLLGAHVDQVLHACRSRRQQIESRYRNFRGQGLADQVRHILTKRSPAALTDGGLSGATQNKYSLIPVNNHKNIKDDNLSAISLTNNSNQSLALPDNVRKKIDFSELFSSEQDGSTNLDNVFMPGTVTKITTLQVVQTSGLKLGHSLAGSFPGSVVQCYPVTLETHKVDQGCGGALEGSKISAQHTESGTVASQESDRKEATHMDAGSLQGARDQSNNAASSQEETDSGYTRQKHKYRPYRPAGSREVYYTDSDGATSVDESLTTLESTHLGSDDAKGPVLPPGAFGSRPDAPKAIGIYGSRNTLTVQAEGGLPPIQERSGLDEYGMDSENSYTIRVSDDTKGQQMCPDVSSGSTLTEVSGLIHSREVHVDNRQANTDEDKTVGSSHSGFVELGMDKSKTGGSHLQTELRNEDVVMGPNASQNYSGTSIESDDSWRQCEFREAVTGPVHQLSDGHRSSEKTQPGISSHLGGSLRKSFTDPQLRGSDTAELSDDTDGCRDPRAAGYGPAHAARGDIRRNYLQNVPTELEPRRTYMAGTSKQFQSSLSNKQHLRGSNHRLPRAHSDEHLYTSAHLSSAFVSALSPDLREAISQRSPTLGYQIERSLQHSASQRSALASSLPASCRKNPVPQGEVAGSKMLPRAGESEPLRQTRSAAPSRQESRQTGATQLPPDSLRFRPKNAAPSSSSAAPRVESKTAESRTLPERVENTTPPNINLLWEQFKATHESSQTSIHSSSLDEVTDLILNPSPHLVAECLRQRQESMFERQQRAEAEKEKMLILKKKQQLESSSEEEISLRYAKLLAQKEEDRLKRRSTRQKNGQGPGEIPERADVNDIADSLFSIPEDASLDHSPLKLKSPSKSRSDGARRPNIIDPTMKKLRERISKQKQKLDRQTMKERQRVQKLKTLEQLLVLKRKGEISDQALEVQLDDMSSSSVGSESSLTVFNKRADSHYTTPLSDDSTTAKDSSTEMHTWKAEKEVRMKETKAINQESKNRNTNIPDGRNRERVKTSAAGYSEMQLLKLVKKGLLTVEEAYRIAVEREGTTVDSSEAEKSHCSSSEDFNNSYHSRLHRFYSPYSKDYGIQAYKHHYVPKLKNSSPGDDERNTHSLRMTNLLQGEERLGHAAFTNSKSRSHNTVAQVSVGRNRAPKSWSPSSKTNSGHAIEELLEPESHRRSLTNYSDSSKSRQQHPASRSPSFISPPVRESRRRSPKGDGLQIRDRPHSPEPSYHPDRALPARTDAVRFRNKENHTGNQRSYRSAGVQGSVRLQTTPARQSGSSLKDATKRESIAWHIPLEVRQKSWSSSRRELPLQEIPLVTNTSSTQTCYSCWPREEMDLMGEGHKRHLQHRLEEDLDGADGGHRRRQCWQEVDTHVTDRGHHRHQQHWKPSTREFVPPGFWENANVQIAQPKRGYHRPEVDFLTERVPYVLGGPDSTNYHDLMLPEPASSQISLQEAFLARKQDFISKCKERQRRLALAREHRRMQECLRLEREALFLDQLRPPRLDVHPLSENLYQPKRRVLTQQQMKSLTMKRYKNLPEVLQKQESTKKKDEWKLNRLRASLFNKKIQRELLQKKTMRQRC